MKPWLSSLGGTGYRRRVASKAAGRRVFRHAAVEIQEHLRDHQSDARRRSSS